MKLNVALVSAASVLMGLSIGVPATAGIAYTNFVVQQYFLQQALGTSFLQSDVFFGVNANSASDFTSVTVSVPGSATPTSIPLTNEPIADGTSQEVLISPPFTGSSAATALAALNAQYPLGTYTFTATNSTTGASQTASLSYGANQFPTVPGSSTLAVPALSTASYNTLQGMNSAVAQTLNFNNFTANGVAPAGSPYVDPFTEIDIVNDSTGALAYATPYSVAGALPASTTTFTLPANTLQAGTEYTYLLGFVNNLYCGTPGGCGPANAVPYNLAFQNLTLGVFQTLAAAPTGSTTVSLTGGTLADPTPLVSQGRVGQVDGSIGGDGAQDFYQFYWGGGTFQAAADLYGAPSSGQYEFELLNQFGSLLDEITLDMGDGFQGEISYDLPTGPYYEIGLVADSAADPNYSITFDTPIPPVPEPGTLGLLGLAAFGLAFRIFPRLPLARWRR